MNGQAPLGFGTEPPVGEAPLDVETTLGRLVRFVGGLSLRTRYQRHAAGRYFGSRSIVRQVQEIVPLFSSACIAKR